MANRDATNTTTSTNNTNPNASEEQKAASAPGAGSANAGTNIGPASPNFDASKGSDSNIAPAPGKLSEEEKQKRRTLERTRDSQKVVVGQPVLINSNGDKKHLGFVVATHESPDDDDGVYVTIAGFNENGELYTAKSARRGDLVGQWQPHPGR